MAKEAIESEERYRSLFEESRDVIFVTTPDGKFLDINPAGVEFHGYSSKEELLKTVVVRDTYMDPGDREIFQEAVAEQGFVKDYELRLKTKNGQQRIALLTATSVYDKEGSIVKYRGIMRDITERKRAEEELKRIEWLLTKSVAPKSVDLYEPPYGDLVELNTACLIADSVGEDILRDIAGDYLDLLDTSGAIYEKNGDYALGMFSSGWCRFLDNASRKLCSTDDNSQALKCGKWLCHESCWTDAAKIAIEKNEPVDIECNGGIRLFAVPIQVGGKIIGSINFGYGDPPKDREKLAEISEKYGVSEDELRVLSDSYESRPLYIIDTAKKRLQASANVIAEITQRKRTEEALLKQQYFLQKAQEIGVIGTWELDIKKDELLWTDEEYRIFGIPTGTKLTYETFLDCVHPDDREYVDKEWNAAFEKKPYDVEHRILVDGKVKWVWQKAELEFDEEGECIRGTGFTQDITERKRGEEALQESEMLNRSLLEGSPVCNKIIDLDFKLRYMSAAGIKHLKIPDIEPYYGQTYPPEFYPESMRAPLIKNLKLAMAGQISAVEAPVHDMEGNEVWYHTTFVPAFDDDGQVKYVIGSSVNITERKRAEEEKEKLRSRLLHAEKMEAIGVLAGGVAHDLNNILSGVTGYPELLLLDLPEDSPLRRPLQLIQDSGQKAAAIVEDMLTLARRTIALREALNLNDIVSNYLQSPVWEKLVSYHPDVQLRSELQTDLLNISGSPVHLSKVVMNLVSNAAEAMPEGGRILISTRNQYVDKPISNYEIVNEGDYAVLVVSDDGVGLAPEDMQRIFEPFYTKKAMGRSGTGLGASVVWQTVKDHNGYIDIQSEEGKGTTIAAYFPATREKLADEEPDLPIEDYMGSGESILVVDDVRGQRELASAMLEKLSYSATSVSSGEEAIEYLESNSVDMLILDMIMEPGIDGLEAYRRIIELHPDQKAIIASGFSETESVKEAQALGAGAYVRKPYTIKKIGLAIKAELEK